LSIAGSIGKYGKIRRSQLKTYEYNSDYIQQPDACRRCVHGSGHYPWPENPASVPAELQWKWRTLISFMIFFLVGYVLFAAVLLGNLRLPQELVTSPIFFVGAIFVFIVVSLTRSTIGMMKEAEENLRLLNESLELKVEVRNRELLAAQEELLRREKLAMLDIVAGNVGNELRNPLGVMRNAVYYLRFRLTDAEESIREYLEIIRTEIDVSQRILADFVDFFHSGPPRKRITLVEELIRQSLAANTVPENVTVSVDIPETLPVIEIDPDHMRQVFQNLIANAVQAMPGGGALLIAGRRRNNTSERLGNPPVSADQSGTPISQPADFMDIAVTDSGTGISPENMNKVFQPLFTTKSRGIGLGLSICKSFVEANGGQITVSSKLGKGATFYRYFAGIASRWKPRLKVWQSGYGQ
jgi:signal transduction histidine kinase